mmetsp:Transcript_41156/g.86436  ORF Transcript_41156/g.86436 Transcript_41156/m.86436 type:complete len:448 (+) Transcript_41156:22-1365(+)
MERSQSTIFLKAHRCSNGREIHYALARLHRDPGSSTAAIIDMENNNNGPSTSTSSIIRACWIFFYPMGPTRRLLSAFLSQYAPHFECDGDVLFLCVNRPGKGATSSSVIDENETNIVTDERRHISTSCEDVRIILDYYNIRKASLFYMCAGSTFAYSFASKYPDRTTGYIIGIASWILRSAPHSTSFLCHGNNTIANVSEDGKENDHDTSHPPSSDCADIKTPQMHALLHRWAMAGYFGPKWLVSSLAGGIAGSMSGILGNAPPAWVARQMKKELSDEEQKMFDERYPDDDGVEFVGLLKWMHGDGIDDETSVFVNEINHGTTSAHNASGADASAAAAAAVVGNNKEGDARDCAVCLSTQEELGLIYRTTIPSQKQVLLWHGEVDKMISVRGAEYLEEMLRKQGHHGDGDNHVTLTKIARGTHQGTMFFVPRDAMEAINRISRDVPL